MSDSIQVISKTKYRLSKFTQTCVNEQGWSYTLKRNAYNENIRLKMY